MKSNSEIQQLLHQAVAHHQAGRLEAAEELYDEVIKADPRNADALHLVGVIAHSRNEIAKAKAYFERALAITPDVADIHLNFGNLLASTEDLAGAEISYARALALRPAFFDAQLGLGGVHYKRANFDEAATAFRSAIRISPQDPRGHYNLGQSLLHLSQRNDAEHSLRCAIDLNPNYLEALAALGDFYTEAGRIQDAIYHTERAAALEPTAERYSNLGELLRQAEDLQSSLTAHEVALKTKPDDPVILHNYGAALYAARHLDQAQTVFEHAIARDPHFAKGYMGLAKIFEHREQFDQATALLEKALALEPGSSDTIFKLAYCYLVVGNFGAGWRNYEHRFLSTDKRQIRRATPPAYWTGENLRGKTILVWMEQGIGDQILYGSMIPDVIAQAEHCIVECTPRMVPVFARSFPRATVTAYKSHVLAATPPDDIDYQIAAASLGMFLRPDFNSFPQQAGFLHTDPVRVAKLRTRYRALRPNNLVVGLSWRSANKDIGKIKTAQLADWAELLSVPGVTFINLQYGDCAEELTQVKQKLGVEIVQDPEIDPLRDMDAFFAQVAAMDLVISSSNTTVHVAGSLGIPVSLLLLGSPGDLWYWFRRRADSPWYPSVTIMRADPQDIENVNNSGWDKIVSQAKADLLKRASQNGANVL